MFVLVIKVSLHSCNLLEEFAGFFRFHMIKHGNTSDSRRCSCLISHGMIVLHPASLPGGLCVILTPVTYELLLHILLAQLRRYR